MYGLQQQLMSGYLALLAIGLVVSFALGLFVGWLVWA